ncbi:MAG: stage II sporulation protein P [Bacillota bacterium]
MARPNDQLKIVAAYLLVVVVGLAMALDHTPLVGARAIPVLARGFRSGARDWTLEAAKSFLRDTIPLMRHTQAGEGEFELLSVRSLLDTAFTLASGGQLSNPRSLLGSQIPLLAHANLPSLPLAEPPPNLRPLPGEGSPGLTSPGTGQPSTPPATNRRFGPEPLVAIYHTHARESFLPTLRTMDQKVVEAFTFNTAVSVVAVGEELAKALTNRHGIPCIHNTTIHDADGRLGAYVESLKTAEALVSQYPGLKMLIDIHRDAGVRNLTTTTIGGLDVAKILIVIGTDRSLPHPKWQENYTFARRIVARMEEKYPGLSSGIRVKDGRYNQHLLAGALLFEMGGHENSLEEAKRAARLLADVLSEVIREDTLANPG